MNKNNELSEKRKGINVIVPLGGYGRRFSEAGFNLPKPLIRVMGKPLLFWVLDSLVLAPEDRLFIPYNTELDSFRFYDIVKRHYPMARLIPITSSIGAAHTLEMCLSSMSEEELQDPIVSLDGDTFYTCDILQLCRLRNNAIVYFEDDGPPIYSYIKIDADRVTDIAEKIKISTNANSGCYIFTSGADLAKLCESVIREGYEPYLSDVFHEMLKNGNRVDAIKVSASDIQCLGTPNQVKEFCRKTQINKHSEQRRYCFDLDNTLVTYPKVEGDYRTVEPIPEVIAHARLLKNLGHTIIVYTARRMKTHAGNVGGVVADIGEITLETLKRFQIPCDELVFGKPFADAYIDDLAVSAFGNLEHQTGFYAPEVIHSRSFNKVEKYGGIFRKSSSNKKLEGELFYYKNIPEQVKSLFPTLLNYGENYYEVEAIEGSSLSDSLIYGNFGVGEFNTLMKALEQLHDICPSEKSNIYENYAKKLKERYETFDYSRFAGADTLFLELMKGLEDYERADRGSLTLVHGDPVFGNALINSRGAIKFIDMRGRQGDTLTIYGDVNYDYAKVLQSLSGYDHILNGLKIPNMTHLRDLLFQRIGEDKRSDICLLTRSLYFSLIPLHDNDKCQQYFELAKNLPI
jgi:capsule biosynthesis phosphatase